MPTETDSPTTADVGDVLRRTPVGASELFPRPPLLFEDDHGRRIEITAAEERTDALVAMYVDYNPADRTQGLPPRTEDGVCRWLDGIFASGLHLVARWDETVVGHTTLVPAEGGTHELAIFVGSDYQHAGISSRLLRTLLGYGRTRGVDRVWLTVARENYTAISLYRATGFETTETGPELEMERPL